VVKVPIPREHPAAFTRARQSLERAMELVATELTALWDDERYVRAPLDEAV
jgi:hypothetical protein